MAAVRDETIEVGDGRLTLHVKVAGDGPPLLFFHPLPGLAWSPLLDRLAGQYTVYAPEHPGTSPGDPQAIREVQTFWELLLVYEEADRRARARPARRARPIALGQSFGGMVAADLAACFPRLFSRLVLVAPLGLWRDDAPIPLVEMVSGPPEAAPGYLYARPEGEGARLCLATPGGGRAEHLERRLHHEVRLAHRRSRPAAAAAPGRGADADRLGARGRARPGRLRGGLRPRHRGQPGRGDRRLRPCRPGRPAGSGLGRDQRVPGRAAGGQRHPRDRGRPGGDLRADRGSGPAAGLGRQRQPGHGGRRAARPPGRRGVHDDAEPR